MSTSPRFRPSGPSRLLPAAVAVLSVGILITVMGVASSAQEQRKAPTPPRHQEILSPHEGVSSDCQDCHNCANPTSDAPCLRECTRTREEEAAAALAQGAVPQGVILLDMLSSGADARDRFGPVPFDHTGHAEWAEIAGGCTVCHHYTPEGAAHPACRSCHEVSFRHEDIRKPGLKGAYHRQCLGCHREWSHETKCDVCHLLRIGERSEQQATSAASKDDVMGKIHPPIPEPELEVYQTKHLAREGTKVVFRHKEHTHRFGFKCAECHRGDSCQRCHEEGKQHEQRVRTLEEHHNPCTDCHDTETPGKCTHCHWEEGQPKPKPFDHASTGWPLSRYHLKNNCRACHKVGVKFVKLDRDCFSCHEGWTPETFDHKLTGQILNETHVEFDCEDCHIDSEFDVPPRCDECHDADEEGISFPTRRPGPTVNGTTTAPASDE
jgi:hypothetical protein